MTRLLVHAKARLALHELRDGEGRPLLLLHALGEAAPTSVEAPLDAWPGPIVALDFTGHGASSVPRGGGYNPEVLMADADVALAEIGTATVVGWGLGGYVSVLLAGGRPREVRGAIVCDGPGLAGGGAEPEGPRILTADGVVGEDGTPDPLALAELTRDVRPPDYVGMFARLAEAHSGLARPITVVARERPAWLRQLLAEPGVGESTFDEALDRYAGSSSERTIE